MATPIRILRSTVKSRRPDSSNQDGAIYVNFPDNQLGVMHDDGGGTSMPKDLIPVRYFSELADYPPNSIIAVNGELLKNPLAVVAGPYDELEWEQVTGIDFSGGGILDPGTF